VIIPGFGGFIGNYTPASIDKASSTFHPPVKQISFNRNLNHNDGLLIKKISGTLNINYGDARTLVEEFAVTIRKKLSGGEKVVFDKIGTFINNQEGNIQFEPDQSVNYHLDSYGLESFQCFPLEAYDVRKRIMGHTDSAKRVTLRKYLWRAAIILPLAGALVTVSLKTDLLKTRVETTTMNPLVSAELEFNKAALDTDITSDTSATSVQLETNITDTAKSEADLPVAETIAKPEVVPAQTTTPAVVSTASYFIITGSFQSEENAGKQVILLQAEGFNPEIVRAKNGFYRVCAMACPDLNTAVSKKDSISKKFPSSWVSRKK
jgi:nucleoid DNA-binding protein/cell division protein FtsL